MRLLYILILISFQGAKLKLHIKESIRYTKDFDSNGEVIGGSLKLTVPKTMTSVRDIEYPDSFDNMWKEAKAHNERDKKLLGVALIINIILYLQMKLVILLAKDILLDNGERLRLPLTSNIRHFIGPGTQFITQMAIDGVPESITQAIVGHKKGSEVTPKIYTHINKESTKKALEQYRINVPSS